MLSKSIVHLIHVVNRPNSVGKLEYDYSLIKESKLFSIQTSTNILNLLIYHLKNESDKINKDIPN